MIGGVYFGQIYFGDIVVFTVVPPASLPLRTLMGVGT